MPDGLRVFEVDLSASFPSLDNVDVANLPILELNAALSFREV